MSIKSALFAGLTTVVLILALGNQWAVERSRDGDFAFGTRTSVTGQLQLAVWDLPSDLQAGAVVRLVLLVVLAAVFGGIVGRARPLAALVGGWAAFLAACVVSAGVYGVVVDERYFGPTGRDVVDRFTSTAGFGVAAGIWLGWLVGLAVMLGSFGKGQPKPAPHGGGAGWAPPPPPPPDGGAAWGAPPPAPPHGDPGAGFGGTPPPPPAAGGPSIGPPPDRTQVFGEPPHRR